MFTLLILCVWLFSCICVGCKNQIEDKRDRISRKYDRWRHRDKMCINIYSGDPQGRRSIALWMIPGVGV